MPQERRCSVSPGREDCRSAFVSYFVQAAGAVLQGRSQTLQCSCSPGRRRSVGVMLFSGSAGFFLCSGLVTNANGVFWGCPLAPFVVHATVDLGVVSSTPVLGIGLT